MNKLIIISVAVLAVLTACTKGNTVVNNSEQNATPDTAALVQRVEEIYAGVFDAYNSASDNGMPAGRLDSLYCSAGWNNLKTAIDELDKKNEDSMGFWDSDYWIMGQDWQDLAISDVRVAAVDASTASVELNLHNCGDVNAVRLEMVREDGAWKIDDFINVKQGIDWKANMNKYLSQSKK